MLGQQDGTSGLRRDLWQHDARPSAGTLSQQNVLQQKPCLNREKQANRTPSNTSNSTSNEEQLGQHECCLRSDAGERASSAKDGTK
jgi:hypothetical protein